MPVPVNAALAGPASYRVMPWKNGGGSTTELLVEPPGASLGAGFLWRLSMASVAASGPFSRFPGIDRSLLLLEGDGLDLEHAGHGRTRLLPLAEPARFPGEWDSTGTLLGGPCLDFNVMSDRARVGHRLTLLRPGPELTALPAAEPLLLFCVRGRAALPELGWTLEAKHLLRCQGGPVAVQALEADTVLLAVAIQVR
jgi:environmental stress-induced protein Ves